jgi:superfamily II DNA/RNA helicase
LDGFKIGKYRILIATDIAARGIDVKEIELVVNYDLPEKSGDYVHRIGRTARAGKSGKALSFVMPDQLKNVREIEKLINKTLKIDKTPAELRAMKGFGSSDRQDQGIKTAFAGRGRAVRQPFRSEYKSRPIQVKSEGEQYNKKTFGAPTSYARKFKSADSDRKRTSNNRSDHSFASDNRNRSSISRQIPMTDKERFRRSMMGGGR